MAGSNSYKECAKICFREAREQQALLETTEKIPDQHQTIGAVWALSSAGVMFQELAKAASPTSESTVCTPAGIIPNPTVKEK